MYGTGAASGTRGWIIPCHLLRLCYKVSGAWCCWLSWGQVSVTHDRRGSRLSHLPQQKNLCWGLHLAPVVFHAHPWTSHWDRKRVLWLSWGRGLGFVSRESGDKVSWADKSKTHKGYQFHFHSNIFNSNSFPHWAQYDTLKLSTASAFRAAFLLPHSKSLQNERSLPFLLLTPWHSSSCVSCFRQLWQA